METTQVADPVKEQLLESLSRSQNCQIHPGLQQRFELAAARLENYDLPSRKQEEWKYSHISRWLKKSYTPQRCNDDLPLHNFLHERVEANVVVLVNGYFRDDLSAIRYPQEGVIIQNMTESCDLFAELLEAHFDRHVQHSFFTDLNTLFHGNGVFIRLEENTLAEYPVHIIHIQTGEKVIAQPRNLILLEKNSKLDIIESQIAWKANNGMTNQVSEFVIGENAQLNYTLTEQTGNTALIHTNRYIQKNNSRLNAGVFTLDGAFVRNNHSAAISGQGCETRLNGTFMPGPGMQTDNHTLLDHRKPHCESDEMYKGILFEGSNAVFNGKIFVNREAQKTNAFLNNSNILMADSAVMETKPELEIYADDVKCSHGSATGDLDEEAMFYLQTRGIGKNSARALLVHAFLNEVVNRIGDENIRTGISRLINDRLLKMNL